VAREDVWEIDAADNSEMAARGFGAIGALLGVFTIQLVRWMASAD
jgi:hypothetical protein